MPRQKGTPKTGGRQKGTLNTKTTIRAAMVDAAVADGETPLEFMLKVMRKKMPATKNPAIALSYATMRFEAAKAAAPYVHPKPAPLQAPRSAPEEYARKIRESVEELDKSVGGSK